MFAAKNLFLSGAAGYSVANSLRFRAANSANFTRTFATPTSATVWTFSVWVKRGALGAARHLLGASTTTFFGFNSSDQLTLSLNGVTAFTSTAVFRDPTAHMHVVYQQNGSAQTCWVNNVSVASGTTAAAIFNTAIAHTLGASNATNFFDGLMSNVTFVDGQALTPSAFGQTDTSSGQWVPKAYTGTYGTNGFFLEFKDASAATAAAIGKDTSGNGNNWTPSGISVTAGVTFDQMTDTPTKNFATLNSANISPTLGSTLNANLTFNSGGGGLEFAMVRATIALTQKFQWECVVPATQTYFAPGVMRADQNVARGGSNKIGGAAGPADSVGYWSSTGIVLNNVTLFADTATAGDILMFAFDPATNELRAGRQGTWLNSGGAVATLASGYTWLPVACDATSQDTNWNFGQRGGLTYPLLSGYTTINTSDMTSTAIPRGDAQFQATLRTGTGATASVTSLAFQPNLVWIKGRSGATDHGLYDSSRGVQAQLESNTITAETTEATGLTAFSTSGYTVGALAQLNTNTATYVDWAWKEDVTPGFDIVTDVGTTTAHTIAHALGAVPHMMIRRNRNTAARQWIVYQRFANASPQNGYLYLNDTSTFASYSGTWNNTSPTSSVFSVGTGDVNSNENLANYVTYLWTSIPGFSLFGSYTGNASADGPFVWCGFKPRWVVIKDVSALSQWRTYDAARNPTNGAMLSLLTNSNAAEASENFLDLLASGFKLRAGTGNGVNDSGNTYIFAAFAECPFKTATAR
jgi:hypothetical protein